MEVIHKHAVYLDRKQSDIYIDAMQGDSNTRVLKLFLYSGGMEWPITDGVSVMVAYVRQDGAKGSYDTLQDGSAAIFVEGNAVSAVLVPQAFAVAGETKLTVVFQDATSGKQLATFCVKLRVSDNPAIGAVKPEDYINMLGWAENEMEKLAEKLHAELDNHADDLTKAFCYIAEDDGEGNLTLRPFHLGDLITDPTLSKTGIAADAAAVGERLSLKAPIGYGLGGTFAKEYTLEDMDSLKKPGWYIVNCGSLYINGVCMGRAALRVDGDALRCHQTWFSQFAGDAVERDLVDGIWGPFYSVAPYYARSVEYRLAELHNGQRVYGTMVEVGTVKAGGVASIELDITAPKVFLDIVRYARHVTEADPELEGDTKHYTYFGNADIKETITTSSLMSDTDGDSEADSITGFVHYLNVENNTDKDLQIRYLLKFTDPSAWN